MTHKFEVGDRVRVTVAYKTTQVGDVGTISSVSQSYSGACRVDIDKGADSVFFYSSELVHNELKIPDLTTSGNITGRVTATEINAKPVEDKEPEFDMGISVTQTFDDADYSDPLVLGEKATELMSKDEKIEELERIASAGMDTLAEFVKQDKRTDRKGTNFDRLRDIGARIKDLSKAQGNVYLLAYKTTKGIKKRMFEDSAEMEALAKSMDNEILFKGKLHWSEK